MLFWSKKGFLVGVLQVGKGGQIRVNLGETCLPVYSGEFVLRKICLAGYLGSRVLALCQGIAMGCESPDLRRSSGQDAHLSSTVAYIGELDKRSVC